MTIKDIAKESGYSVSTVSRVLNNRDDVSPEAEKKIDVYKRQGWNNNTSDRK